MCIATFALGRAAGSELVLAANRDELHCRPTAAADWWPDAPAILGGRDLVAGGSWLAVDRAGRLAAVTNIPAEGRSDPARSRGELVREFLTDDRSAADFIAGVAARADDFGPFNFLAYDGSELHLVGTFDAPRRLDPGVYALSNAPLGADWPKIRAAREALSANLAAQDLESILFGLLARGAGGIARPVSREQRRLNIFVADPDYGTRCSTVVSIAAGGRVRFAERSFTAAGAPAGERSYEFQAHN